MPTQLVGIAVADAQSPLHGYDPYLREGVDGRLRPIAEPALVDSHADILIRNGRTVIEAIGSGSRAPIRPGTG
ncbi:hypothetical protein [Nocardia sp. NPDC004604]|uniref:hypothetical protein n=1 Tax=Nocardia sp. NPDC004604 TaxID=3157013 RepID=UPI0033BECE87